MYDAFGNYYAVDAYGIPVANSVLSTSAAVDVAQAPAFSVSGVLDFISQAGATVLGYRASQNVVNAQAKALQTPSVPAPLATIGGVKISTNMGYLAMVAAAGILIWALKK